MSEADEPIRRDPHERPDDPAGTKPKVDPSSLVPAIREPLVSAPSTEADVDTDAYEVDEHGDLLPQRMAALDSAVGPVRTADSPHSPKFQFFLGALFALGLAAVAAVVLLAVRGNTSEPSGPGWSAWRPAGGNVPSEIADHVGQEYKLSSGQQLAVVTGGPMEVAGLPLTIALREPVAAGGNVKLVDGKGVLYRLCGLGEKCAIATGKPSRARHLLLRREALELALYTFRYTDADNVVAFLPPRRGQDPSEAVYFRRSDVSDEIGRPLAATLTRTAPLPNTVAGNRDSAFVDRITLQRLFQFSLTQANQDNRAFLVLQPLS